MVWCFDWMIAVMFLFVLLVVAVDGVFFTGFVWVWIWCFDFYLNFTYIAFLWFGCRLNYFCGCSLIYFTCVVGFAWYVVFVACCGFYFMLLFNVLFVVCLFMFCGACSLVWFDGRFNFVCCFFIDGFGFIVWCCDYIGVACGFLSLCGFYWLI